MTTHRCLWLGMGIALLAPAGSNAEVASRLLPLVKRSYEVRLQGGIAYVATTVGLRIVDVHRLARPRLLGTLVTRDSLNGLAVAGGYAYLAAGPQGVSIADVHDPRHPRQVARRDTPGSANAVALAGPLLYVADGSFGVAAYDVSNPRRPVRRATWKTGCYTRDVAARGGWVFVACGRRGLLVLPALGRPGAGSARRPARLRGDVRAIAFGAPDTLYVAAGEAGLLVVDVTRPQRPRVRASAPVADYARGVAVHGKRVAVADGEAGVFLLDVSGSRPRRLGSYRTRKVRSADHVVLTGAGLLVAYDAAGLHLLRVEPTGRLVRRAVFPRGKK